MHTPGGGTATASASATKADWTAGDARQTPGRRNSAPLSGYWSANYSLNFPAAECADIAISHPTSTGMEK
ncbi:hypothetical protein GGR06_000015 [Bacteroides reticulotermitis]|uniref:Uncharacterized protein n=1 Tax=Bacteroides reticulotermitis TaxID=1133319 RepID=A0A840CSI7_9BACE|nr:hypothetical protein [Bacteroides reticulotermitis]